MNTIAILLAVVFGLQGDPNARVSAVPVPECPSKQEAGDFVTGFRARHPEITHIYLNCIKTNIAPDGSAPNDSHTKPQSNSQPEIGTAPRPGEVGV